MATRPLARAVANDWPAVREVRGRLQAQCPDRRSQRTHFVNQARSFAFCTLCSACSHSLAYRSSHHAAWLLPLPTVPSASLDAGTAPSPWHAHHVAPPHVHHRARTARHSKPSLSTSLRQASTVPSLHEPSLSPQPSLTAQMASAEVCSCTESRRFELSPPSPAREAHLSWQPHRPVRGCQQHHQRLSDSPCGDDAHAS